MRGEEYQRIAGLCVRLRDGSPIVVRRAIVSQFPIGVKLGSIVAHEGSYRQKKRKRACQFASRSAFVRGRVERVTITCRASI